MSRRRQIDATLEAWWDCPRCGKRLLNSLSIITRHKERYCENPGSIKMKCFGGNSLAKHVLFYAEGKLHWLTVKQFADYLGWSDSNTRARLKLYTVEELLDPDTDYAYRGGKGNFNPRRSRDKEHKPKENKVNELLRKW